MKVLLMQAFHNARYKNGVVSADTSPAHQYSILILRLNAEIFLSRKMYRHKNPMFEPKGELRIFAPVREK